MRPFEEEVERLDVIPGIGRTTAEAILAEIGTQMDCFPTAAHLCSWAGVAPGNHESAGKRKSGRTTQGNPALRCTLVDAARSAPQTKNTHLSEQYHRIAARRRANRAAVAVAHTMLVIIYHMLTRYETYRDGSQLLRSATQGPNGQQRGEEVGESGIHGHHYARNTRRVGYVYYHRSPPRLIRMCRACFSMRYFQPGGDLFSAG